ncbi:Arylsulfatase K [Liparis tanakae]|uniref:Arylsulfatase K n=1 Tax=Liparis tanakae TaxID=230148 RepID=A0A4Z2FDK5_9TELE|nr:Arylsulfatase K [Liparis tanakae]
MKTEIFRLIFLCQIYGQSLCRNESRPNIVMVMSDAFDGRLTFDPGSKVVQLPYVNYLRELGTTFLNAYTNSPICCPSRAAMWSGRFVHLTQSWNNYKCLDANATTWMDLLEANGYFTESMGKLDYTSGSHSVSNRVEAWTRDVRFVLRQEGRPVAQLVGNTSTVRIMRKDWENTDKATQWIHQRAASSRQPFALYLGLNLPHPYKTESLGPTAGGSTFLTSPYWLKKACCFCSCFFKVSSEHIAVPEWLPLAAMHPVDYYSSVSKNCSGAFTEDEVKSIRAFYYAMCAEADAMLGQVISALRATGLLDNTVVIFAADHGELAMEHRQFYKMSMFEGSSHVPLLVMGPGLMSGLQVKELVSLVDLYPTVLDIAGIPAVGNLSGHTLLPLLSKARDVSKKPRPDWVLSEYHGCNVNASTYMLRSGRWKYIAYADSLSVPPQLFDITRDKEELHNVALKFRDVQAHLDKILRGIVDYPKGLANLYEKTDQWDFQLELPNVYQRLVELYASSDKNKCYEIISKLSDIYQSDKEYLKLITAFEKAMVLMDPVPGEQHMKVSADYVKCLSKLPEDESKVIAACESMLSLYPDQSYPLEVLCAHYLKTGVQNEDAVRCFSRLLDLAPDSGLGHLGLGTKALQEGRFKDAVQDLAQGLKRLSSSTGWCSLAEAQFKMQRYLECAESCSQGLTACVSGDEQLRVKLLKLQFQALVGSGGDAAAERALETFSQIPDAEKDPVLGALKGRAYLNKGQVDEALKVSSELVASNPDLAQGFVLRGLAQLAQGQQQLAEESFLKAASQSPDCGEYYFFLGRLYWDMGEETRKDRSKAHTHLLKAAKLDPHLGCVFRYLGHYYRQVANDHSRARGCYKKAFEMDSHDAESGAASVDLSMEQGDMDTALAILQSVIEKATPGSAKWAWMRRGLYYLKIGEHHQAVSEYVSHPRR